MSAALEESEAEDASEEEEFKYSVDLYFPLTLQRCDDVIDCWYSVG